MVSLKINRLKKINDKKMCETHNDKKTENNKIKLSTYKAYNYEKVFHPLKNKKIKLHRLKFVNDIIDYESHFGRYDFLKSNEILSKKYRTNVTKQNQKTMWANEDDVINWLISIGVEIKCIAEKRYVLKNKVCSINHVMILANKKRIELGLDPFYMEGVTEF